MHHSRTFPPLHATLPPFGAAGWLVTVLSEPGPRRDAQPASGEFYDCSPRGGIEPTRLIAKAQRRTRPFGSALYWLLCIRYLQIRKA